MAFLGESKKSRASDAMAFPDESKKSRASDAMAFLDESNTSRASDAMAFLDSGGVKRRTRVKRRRIRKRRGEDDVPDVDSRYDEDYQARNEDRGAPRGHRRSRQDHLLDR